MNLLSIILFGVIALAVIIFLIKQNQKNKNELENYLNNDYPKTKDKERDIEID